MLLDPPPPPLLLLRPAPLPVSADSSDVNARPPPPPAPSPSPALEPLPDAEAADARRRSAADSDPLPLGKCDGSDDMRFSSACRLSNPILMGQVSRSPVVLLLPEAAADPLRTLTDPAAAAATAADWCRLRLSSDESGLCSVSVGVSSESTLVQVIERLS